MLVIKFCKCKLIDKPKRQLRMLQHMVEAEKLKLILSGVDFVVRILEIRLDNEGRRVAGLRCRCVVGTCISAFCENVRDVAVLARRLAAECNLHTSQKSFDHEPQ
jgi:hypothetical protein